MRQTIYVQRCERNEVLYFAVILKEKCMTKHVLARIMTAAVVVVFLFALFTPCQAAPKEYKLKAVSAWPKTIFEVQNFMKFLDIVKEKVAKECPGELAIDYVGGPEVMPNREQVEALRNGLVDMVFTTVGYYVSIIPEADGLNLTALRPWEERAKGVNDFLNKIHQEKANAFYLGRLGSGNPFALYLIKPITKLSDLKGMKIRGSPTHIPFIKALGAQPVVIPPPDVYTALERGLVDGYMWPVGLIRDWGWNEVTKYIVEPFFYEAVNIVLINIEAWKKLPKNLQDLLIAAEEQAEHYAVDRAHSYVQTELTKLQKEGIKIIKLPPDQAKEFKKLAYDSMWDVVIKKAPENGPKLKEMISK